MSTSVKHRVKEAYFGDPITSLEELKQAKFETQLPFTFRGDEVVISEDMPDEEEYFSHEVDTPMHVEYDFKPTVMTGAFFGMTDEQKKLLLGGEVAEAVLDGRKGFIRPSNRPILNKSIRLNYHDGTSTILFNVTGIVTVNNNVGKDGVAKHPFKFTCKAASPSWQMESVDLDAKGNTI